ncbi:MAG: secreted protein [Acidobacteriales bacterium]|nr:secreted protein [Terriglobales bacterium]
MRRILMFCLAALCLGYTSLLSAQDAVKVDPKHYKVVSENDQVRILKVHYAPHEKSVMHSHPASVAVMMSDAKMKFTMPDGKTQEMAAKSGESMYSEAATHNPEVIGDTQLDMVLIELKGHKSATKAAADEPAAMAKAAKK